MLGALLLSSSRTQAFKEVWPFQVTLMTTAAPPGAVHTVPRPPHFVALQ